MSLLALTLVLTSAVLHATWNLFAKRSGGGAEFVWSFALATVVIYAPVLLVYLLVARPEVRAVHVVFALVSGVIHMAYFVSLQRGYRAGDLSLVYPVARGTGPALATVLAILFLAERPGTLAVIGTVLIVLSVFVLSGGGNLLRARGRALAYGLTTGVFIGIYTVWDGYAVGHLGAAPLLFTFMGEITRVLLLTPLALARRQQVVATWRSAKGAVLAVAVLSPLAYVLVLTAMTFTPVSLVAPAREVSILIGTVMGARLLSEAGGRQRILGAIGMVAGVALLSLS